jgi:two-component system sensor histidine kinase YesM
MEDSSRACGFFFRRERTEKLDSLPGRSYDDRAVRTFLSRKRSVRSTLFASYLLLIVLTMAFMTVFSSFYTADALRRVAINGLRDLSAKLIDSLDAELFKMNSVSVAVASSDSIKRMLKERAALPAGTVRDAPLLRYRNAAALSSAMQTIIGPYKPVPQVNVYTLRGEVIGAGVFGQAAPAEVPEVLRLSGVDLRSGTKQLSLPHEDALLSRVFPQHAGRTYISLYRTLFDEYRNALGVIEVEQFSDTVFRGMSSESSQVSIFDGRGMQIFPWPGDVDPSGSAAILRAHEGETFTLRDTRAGTTGIVMVAGSGQSGWRLAVSREQRLLLKPVRDYTTFILLFGLALIVGSTFVAARLAARVTYPLRWIHSAISDLDWTTVSRESSDRPAERLDELQELELAFQDMRRKLRESMDEALEARAHELQATLLALQSQMDPHFVYNMLTTIGIMAEQGMQGEIAPCVENMTHLLRYISSGKSSTATIGEEIEYARRYVACMKLRYRESLEYEIDVPPELFSIEVPKLIIQPIIENAMKYGLRNRPPWRLSIRGQIADGRWTAQVSDNGPGFPPERLEEIREKIEERMSSAPDPALSISGMGLLNISTRLRIFYEDDAIYRIGNNPDGGATVVIGGDCEPRAGVLGHRR